MWIYDGRRSNEENIGTNPGSDDVGSLCEELIQSPELFCVGRHTAGRHAQPCFGLL